MTYESDNTVGQRSRHTGYEGIEGFELPMRRILVIDDDPHLVAVLTEGLRVLGGFEVYAASDGVMGLHGIATTQPDCVILDIRMPGLNGYQILRLLRGDPQTANLPVVVLSGLAHDHEALAGLLSGADAYLFKPVHIADVFRTVRAVMALPAAERSLRRRHLLDPMSASSSTSLQRIRRI